MSALFDAARDLETSLEIRGWGFCFIGGLAVLRWGEPRFTRDADTTLLCPFGSEDEVSAGSLAFRGLPAKWPRRSQRLLYDIPT
jgi:hypothetical protein